MIRFIKFYLEKNLFYVSVIITGITSLLFGVFYTLFKDSVFERASSEFLEGTGVLEAYITSATSRPSEINYFVIAIIAALLFFFIISLLLHFYLKKDYFKIFNLLSCLNVILIFILILSCIFIKISNIFTYVILIAGIILYLFILYKNLKFLFKLGKKQIVISLLIFICPIIITLILLKLFV